MDLISAKRDTSDADAFRKKLQEEIQKIMDSPIVVGPAVDLSHLPYPLPPFKPDDVNFEKLDWIIPPIPVKPEDECRKENCNDTRDQKD
jgi:hypothetical protein